MADILKKGGGFLLNPSTPDEIFTCEDFEEEDLMFAKTALDFATNEVLTRKDEIENAETKVAVNAELLKKMFNA